MHILNNVFEQIYLLYINNFELVRAKKKLEDKGIIANYFKGVDGKCNDSGYKEYIVKHTKYKNIHSTLNEGSYGHISSFINILKDAKKNNYKKIIIFEADIYFCEDFDIKCARYLDMKFKLLYFGASQNKFYREDTWDVIDKKYSKNLKSGYYFANKTLGTFAVGIDNSIYDFIINILSKYEKPTDVAFTDIHNKYREECIVCYPNIICCDLSKSNTTSSKNQIESFKKLRWTLNYDFSDYMKYLVHVDSWYEFIFEINSMLKGFSITIGNITINKNNIDKYITKNHYRVSFYSDDTYIEIFLKNIFFSKSYIKRINNSTKIYMKKLSNRRTMR